MSNDEHLEFINQMLAEADQLHSELPASPPIPADLTDDEILELGDNFDFRLFLQSLCSPMMR